MWVSGAIGRLRNALKTSGGQYHVTYRASERRATVREDRDRDKWLSPAHAAPAVAEAFRVEPSTRRARGTDGNDARSAAIDLRRKLTDATGRGISAYFGGASPSAVSDIMAEINRAREQSRQLNAKLVAREMSCREK